MSRVILKYRNIAQGKMKSIYLEFNPAINDINQILISSHFVVLHIGCGNGVEQLLCTINFGSFDG